MKCCCTNYCKRLISPDGSFVDVDVPIISFPTLIVTVNPGAPGELIVTTSNIVGATIYIFYIDNVIVGTSSTPNFTITGLNDSTTYEVTVRYFREGVSPFFSGSGTTLSPLLEFNSPLSNSFFRGTWNNGPIYFRVENDTPVLISNTSGTFTIPNSNPSIRKFYFPNENNLTLIDINTETYSLDLSEFTAITNLRIRNSAPISLFTVGPWIANSGLVLDFVGNYNSSQLLTILSSLVSANIGTASRTLNIGDFLLLTSDPNYTAIDSAISSLQSNGWTITNILIPFTFVITTSTVTSKTVTFTATTPTTIFYNNQIYLSGSTIPLEQGINTYNILGNSTITGLVFENNSSVTAMDLSSSSWTSLRTIVLQNNGVIPNVTYGNWVNNNGVTLNYQGTYLQNDSLITFSPSGDSLNTLLTSLNSFLGTFTRTLNIGNVFVLRNDIIVSTGSLEGKGWVINDVLESELFSIDTNTAPSQNITFTGSGVRVHDGTNAYNSGVGIPLIVGTNNFYIHRRSFVSSVIASDGANVINNLQFNNSWVGLRTITFKGGTYNLSLGNWINNNSVQINIQNSKYAADLNNINPAVNTNNLDLKTLMDDLVLITTGSTNTGRVLNLKDSGKVYIVEADQSTIRVNETTLNSRNFTVNDLVFGRRFTLNSFRTFNNVADTITSNIVFTGSGSDFEVQIYPKPNTTVTGTAPTFNIVHAPTVTVPQDVTHLNEFVVYSWENWSGLTANNSFIEDSINLSQFTSLRNVSINNANLIVPILGSWVNNNAVQLDFTNSIYNEPELATFLTALQTLNGAATNPSRVLLLGNVLIDDLNTADPAIIAAINDLQTKGWTINITNFLVSLIYFNNISTVPANSINLSLLGGTGQVFATQFTVGVPRPITSTGIVPNIPVRVYHTVPNTVTSFSLTGGTIKANCIVFFNTNSYANLFLNGISPTSLQTITINDQEIITGPNADANICYRSSLNTGSNVIGLPPQVDKANFLLDMTNAFGNENTSFNNSSNDFYAGLSTIATNTSNFKRIFVGNRVVTRTQWETDANLQGIRACQDINDASTNHNWNTDIIVLDINLI